MNNLGQRKVAYWGIDTPIADYDVSGVPAISTEQTKRAASMRTRLNAFAPEEIDLLLTVGYAGATASLSARGLIANQRQATFDALPLRSSG
ncbi:MULTISPECIES: hypothetical protein [unclassified Bradyrhizobium]|jgi:NTE family protein|uniref:hypothetical protein n=1 Tax=unclassified Bradyrhizobium TaxID=2631580 RepID=UPI00070A445B|nr:MULTISPECIES: hypothetical protein [unclassified Bradyrhizobium]KQT07199.1 hypothetical protein ASG57_35785 [Bradyrhizobium sp. Leaf396]